MKRGTQELFSTHTQIDVLLSALTWSQRNLKNLLIILVAFIEYEAQGFEHYMMDKSYLLEKDFCATNVKPVFLSDVSFNVSVVSSRLLNKVKMMMVVSSLKQDLLRMGMEIT